MKLTNKFGLPDAFFRAIQNDPYDSKSDFSASSISNPARATALIAKHGADLEIDVSGRVAATIGQGAHSILERAARPAIDIIETRYMSTFTVDGLPYTVSAQIDLLEQDSGTLYDWKTTKSYAFHKKSGAGKKPDWIVQLNIGLELLRRNGLDAKSLQIIGLLKDWDKRKAATEQGYPPTEVMTVECPIWEREKTCAYIEERIRAHVAAKVELPQCSTKETWGGNRCGQWCDANSVCDQYQSMLKTGLVKQEEPA